MSNNTPAQLRTEAERLTREAEVIELADARDQLRVTNPSSFNWTIEQIGQYAEDRALTYVATYAALTELRDAEAKSPAYAVPLPACSTHAFMWEDGEHDTCYRCGAHKAGDAL